MKMTVLLAMVLISFIAAAQVKIIDDLPSIIESEKKAALQIMQGERNLNTGNYDLKYHRLELDVDPNIAFLSGVVTSYFVAKENLNEITFELTDNMVVSEVKQRGINLTYVQNNDDEVVINLTQTQNIGVLDSLTISYSGDPTIGAGYGAFKLYTHNGDPIISTLSVAFRAKHWWPCKQDLNDKVDEIDVYITTPKFNPSNEEYVAVSNGLEQSQVVSGNYKTTHFKHQYPIPAYLIAIAVTNYEVYSHEVANNGNPFDVVNYVYPEDLSDAQSSSPITVDIMNFYTDLFEEYPFANEKYGHAQAGSGGMEHTTVSFMEYFDMGLIAHELAHQWFGNKITCGSWQDVWLNEGFASYLTYLFLNEQLGEEYSLSGRENNINYITSEPDGSVYIPAQDTIIGGRIFDGRLSYRKPSLVLHMLNRKLGEAMFFQGIQEYLADPNFAYSNAKTPDFITKMENASGVDLTEFFNDWIYGEGYPTYHLEWIRENASEIKIVVNQIQSHSSVSFFEASLPIRVYGTEGEAVDLILDNTLNGEEFFENITFEINNIVVDPDYHLISRNNTVVILGTDEFSIVNNISITPNPAQEIIHINKPASIEIEKVKIYNVLGQLVREQKFSETIDISGLPKGMHFVYFETNLGRIHKTLQKQ